MFKFRLAIVLLIAGFLNVEQVVKGVPQFKRCYNTSEEETHCFDVQYNTATDQPFYTSFQNAQKRCMDLNSTLVTIENEEIDNLIQQFMHDVNNPLWNQYFWLNAYQVNNYDNSLYRWRWLNSTLPSIPGSAVWYTYDSGWYTAVVEFRTDGSQFYVTAKQPLSLFYYVCEYSASNCSSANSNDVRLMNDRCYRAVHVQELATWYNARNKCLKDGGDLASFADVTSINFTSWLGSDPNVRFWIGLRFLWYTWGEQGQEMKYTNWDPNGGKWDSKCVIYCFNCNPTFSWSSKPCTDNMYSVCHTITPVEKITTTATSTSVTTNNVDRSTTMSIFTAATFPSKGGSASIIPVAVGVGVGVGVPVIAGIIVLIICVVRKRRNTTESSVKSTNRQQAESSIDDRSEVGDNTTYGVVVPSKSPRETDEENEANSPAEQTVYAPLQIL